MTTRGNHPPIEGLNRTMCRLFLLRHGATEYTAMDLQQGQLDIPLSPSGSDQARSLADRFSEEPLTAIYSSSLERSRKTAEILAGPHDLDVGVEPTLRERSVGDYEGEPASVVRARLRELNVTWSEWKPPNGETRAEAVARARPTVERLCEIHQQEQIAIVAHSGVNKGLLTAFIGAGARLGHRLGQDLACINELEYISGECRIIRVNDTCHL